MKTIVQLATASVVLGLGIYAPATEAVEVQAHEVYAAIEDNGAHPVPLSEGGVGEELVSTSEAQPAVAAATEARPSVERSAESRMNERLSERSALKAKKAAENADILGQKSPESAAPRTVESSAERGPDRESSSDANAFEPVPMDQAVSIAGRLKLVEQILLKYGRAYDYRTHTTRELQELLDSLGRR